MSVANNIVLGRSVAQTGTPCMARMQNVNTGQYLTQASVMVVNYVITDLNTGLQVTTRALAPNAIIFDTLQTNDPSWVQDSLGYNIKYTIPASDLSWTPQVDNLYNPIPHRFQAELEFIFVSGQPQVLTFLFWASPAYSS